jgi:hypothetical protein
MDIYDEALARIQAKLAKTDILPKDEGELSAKAVKKIESLAERFGIAKETVMDAVLTNLVAYRVIVGKNPSKMDYYEDTLKSYLEKLPEVKTVKKLPKSGKNSLHVRDGRIVSHVKKNKMLKSLDLEVEFQNGETVYVIHKYTRDSGGTQGSASRDAIMTLKEGLSPNGSRILNLVGILDGPFYQMKNKNGESRIALAKQEDPQALLCTYLDFSETTRPIWESKAD